MRDNNTLYWKSIFVQWLWSWKLIKVKPDQTFDKSGFQAHTLAKNIFPFGPGLALVWASPWWRRENEVSWGTNIFLWLSWTGSKQFSFVGLWIYSSQRQRFKHGVKCAVQGSGGRHILPPWLPPTLLHTHTYTHTRGAWMKVTGIFGCRFILRVGSRWSFAAIISVCWCDILHPNMASPVPQCRRKGGKKMSWIGWNRSASVTGFQCSHKQVKTPRRQDCRGCEGPAGIRQPSRGDCQVKFGSDVFVAE